MRWLKCGDITLNLDYIAYINMEKAKRSDLYDIKVILMVCDRPIELSVFRGDKGRCQEIYEWISERVLKE